MSDVRPGAVLWDLGGVFLDWDPRHLYRKLFGGDVAAMEQFLTEVCSPRWHAQQDCGRNVLDACSELKGEFPQHGALIDAWWERSEEMINGVIDGTVPLLAEVKLGGAACYALSNMERENWAKRLGVYPFLHWFDGYFISGLEGVMKPDDRFFWRALGRFGLGPEEVLFVDDRAANVSAARTLGIASILFRGAGPLRDELATRGLLEG
ncbi:MAG TPA: HAD family phosphatase [Acidimicrobiales bacterium]|nr:HAD family phosphatase [Acidimicrobiales bacterium]